MQQLYPELLKRLDDSNDHVRKVSCETFIHFLRAASPQCFRGTPLEYSLETLFVHLDDAEKSVQEAVFEVVKECVRIDKTLVAKKATEHRARHRSPLYCDELIKMCL